MTRDELLAAKPGIVDLIRGQGESRLANQAAFADAQDVRGSALLTAAVSLAAAATAVACGAAALKEIGPAPIAGGIAAAAGFTVSALLAVLAMRSTGFHAVGWYPQDFEDDLANNLSNDEVKADLVLALQRRLAENKPILNRRGNTLDWSSYLMMGTPAFALVVALLVSK